MSVFVQAVTHSQISKYTDWLLRWLLVLLPTVFICCYFNTCKKDRSVVFKPFTQGNPKGQPNCQGTPVT